MFRLHDRFAEPVMIESIEVLRRDGNYFVRTRSADGAEGFVMTNSRMPLLVALMEKSIAPFFIGKDARDLETLVDAVFAHASNYKFAGIALWIPVACIEHSLLDLFGKMAGMTIGQLGGEVWRSDIPVYLSSGRRDTTPEEEIEWVGARVAATGAHAVKMKIGGRMRNNADAMPGRTEQLTALARQHFGEAMTLYLDANGSYDAEKAIEVGRMLESYGVAFYEEPCPFEWYEATAQVNAALDIPVAGGEQDSSAYHFQRMIRDRIVDIVQPDLFYNGGFIRAMRVAQWAAEAQMFATPHSPQGNPIVVPMLHYASMVRNSGPFLEFGAQEVPQPDWYRPHLIVENGVVPVPVDPGMGVTYDPDFIAGAEVVMHLARD